MRHRVALPFVLLLFLAPADGQDSGPIVTPFTAQDHIGQLATICGPVAEYSCDRDRPFMTLTLAPVDQAKPLKIGITDADRNRFGKRLEDRFIGQTVCVRGSIQDAPQEGRTRSLFHAAAPGLRMT
jgi:hypothetical protein